ncbi:ribokinase [Curtobacterium sp. MCSS17_006]|nr:ribokinase [Curtobacterium sp. MCSS17_006]
MGSCSNAPQAVVVGQIARDLVLEVDRLPSVGGSAPVGKRIERLGGKGANHALGLRQLGIASAVVGVVGTDDAGDAVLEEAARERIDTSVITRRGRTALLVDLVVDGGRRLFEDVPGSALTTPDDVASASAVFMTASVVTLQLQQPADALLRAAQLAQSAGARIVLDGATGTDDDALVEVADVVRADAIEAEILTGSGIASRQDAARATRQLLGRGASVAAVTVPGAGDFVDWGTGSAFLPYGDIEVVDPTGGGDAFVAGLVAALISGADPRSAAESAARAAASTVAHLGGRPDLSS